MTPLTTARLTQMIEAAERSNLDDAEWFEEPALLQRGMPAHDAAHIAACDPQTIIILCRIALAAAEAFRDGPVMNGDVSLCDALREAFDDH